VLESGEVRPVGSAETRRVDVRVIAATNQDPLLAVRRGRLREDLFYRLNVFHLVLPPLRERREDIPLLAAYFVERKSREVGKEVARFAPDAQRALMRYEYPGNVRELQNAIERAVILADGDAITLENLPPVMSGNAYLLGTGLQPGRGARRAMPEETVLDPDGGADGGRVGRVAALPTEPGFDIGYPATWSLEEVERAHIERVLLDLGGNVSLAARRLGISRTTLWRKMKHHELTSPKSRTRGRN
jgi:two-component system nitrogen regulation response regulator GlnG